uniref:GTP-binding protein SAR1A n=1 Tax=Tanacetum cinerariifolium TaxID=118510 RepID=A0A6L2KXU5_TANCI|nr:GTP-binding protein SAR1A [Tanacetum cinerariifolium]
MTDNPNDNSRKLFLDIFTDTVLGLAFRCKVDAVVYLVDAYDRERFAESKKELDALLSDESLATVPFLILGNKIDIPYAASEEELRYHMNLQGSTTGKGKVNLENSGVRPLEESKDDPADSDAENDDDEAEAEDEEDSADESDVKVSMSKICT